MCGWVDVRMDGLMCGWVDVRVCGCACEGAHSTARALASSVVRCVLVNDGTNQTSADSERVAPACTCRKGKQESCVGTRSSVGLK